MSPTNTGQRPAYKVEELLALRASASESRVSLEKFPNEEVIKEHVIKPKGDGNYSASTENLPPNPAGVDGSVNGTLEHAQNIRANHALAAGQPGAYKRPSPTPSIKRYKVSELLKNHGSPPHVRVTAGGRIVPNDLPQLGSPRVPYTPVYRGPPGSGRMPHILPNGAPGNSQLPQGFLGYNGYGKLIQWVDGRWHDVRHDVYGQPMYQITPPNMPFPSANSVFNMLQPPPMQHPMMPAFEAGYQAMRTQPASVASVAPGDIDEQISLSQAEYERVRQEKIELERHEVKTSDQLSAAQRTQIVAEKRKYVLMLDTIRKKIKDLETIKANGGTCAPLSNGNDSSNGGTGVSTFPNPVYNMGGIDGAIGNVVTRKPWPIQAPGLFPPGPFMAPPWQSLHPAQASAAADVASRFEHPPAVHRQSDQAVDSPVSEASPSSRAQPRRTHAVRIVPPTEGYNSQDEGGNERGHPSIRHDHLSANGEHPSNLNPTSPSYEPGKPYPLTEGSPPHFVVPAPTPIETPKPPPAELAKHWVFTQQHMHATHTNMQQAQEHARIPVNSVNGRHPESLGSGAPQHTGNNGYGDGGAQTNRSSGEDNGERSSQHPTSHSSVTTTDFFPTNTHDHSLNKYMSRKTSGAQRMSMEANPCTPMRDQHSGVVSPMTDQLHPPAPPVSPAAHYGVPPHLLANSPEDMRMSSFLRDTARVPTRSAEEQIPQHSPVRAETRDEFHGKSRPYLEGYLAGSSGHAPSDPKNQEYCAGYIDGLSKMCLGGSNVTRESSTVSLKSDTISVSRTPPNTSGDRSLIAELAGNIPARSENVRLTQSLNFSSPPSGSNHPGNEALSNGSSHQALSAATPADGTKSRVASGAGYSLAGASHLPRSWSEDNGGFITPKGGFHQVNVLWTSTVPSHQTQLVHNEFAITQPRSAITSQGTKIGGVAPNRRSDRVVNTSLASQPSLTGYSGNQPSARVGSVPQHSVFGDDKYIVTSATTTTETNKAATTTRYQSHENRPSISTTISHNSTYDGAMDDLAEMKTASGGFTGTTKHEKNTSSMGTGYPTNSNGHNTPRSKMPTTTSTPAGSPSKSTSSPKKVTSPRHHLQKLKDKVGDYLDRSSYCGGGESGAPSRAESPDPKHMSPEEKKRWKDGWRTKLGGAKTKEAAEVKKWRRDGGGSGANAGPAEK